MTTYFDSVPGLSANITRGLIALDKVLREKTTVHRAMHREGLGWIDFVWGDEGKWPPNAKERRHGGKGLAHAIEARKRKDGLNHDQVVTLLKKMIHVIADGVETKRVAIPPSTRVIVGKDGTEVHLTHTTGSNAWVLTVFDVWDDVTTGAMDAVSDANHPTHNRPLLSSDIGAVVLVADAIDPSLDHATHSGLLQERLPVGAADSQTLDSINIDVNLTKKSITMKQPPMITYNLKERGRLHRGQKRSFNIKALMDSINGPACQERVKTRAMLGYFGHKPRVLFGMEPVESGVVAGKYNEIEPALVTTYLKAFPDGTIKHQSEFLDSLSGRKAARMFANRIGGFSSVIDQGKHEMFGFDYVLDPNFSTNRGFSLDSVGLTFDQVLDEARSEEDEFWTALINTKDRQLNALSEALDSARIENEELLSILTNAGIESAAKTPILPISVSLDSTHRFERDKDAFRREARLPGFIAIVSDDKVKSERDYNSLLAQMGISHV